MSRLRVESAIYFDTFAASYYGQIDYNDVSGSFSVCTRDGYDMSEPVMTAVSSRFLWGRVGVGSFDDIGQFDDLELRGQLWSEGD